MMDPNFEVVDKCPNLKVKTLKSSDLQYKISEVINAVFEIDRDVDQMVGSHVHPLAVPAVLLHVELLHILP